MVVYIRRVQFNGGVDVGSPTADFFNGNRILIHSINSH